MTTKLKNRAAGQFLKPNRPPVKKFVDYLKRHPNEAHVIFQMCAIGAALGTLAYLAQVFTRGPVGY